MFQWRIFSFEIISFPPSCLYLSVFFRFTCITAQTSKKFDRADLGENIWKFDPYIEEFGAWKVSNNSKTL